MHAIKVQVIHKHNPPKRPSNKPSYIYTIPNTQVHSKYASPIALLLEDGSVHVAWSNSIWSYFFLFNKKALGARSGKRVTLDLCAHACITASRSNCSAAGTQPKPVVVHVMCVALMMTEKVEQSICIKFCQKLGHSHSETYNMMQKAFGNEDYEPFSS